MTTDELIRALRETDSDTRSAVIDWLGKETKRGNICETMCRYAPPSNKWPCVDCDMRYHDRAEPSKEEP